MLPLFKNYRYVDRVYTKSSGSSSLFTDGTVITTKKAVIWSELIQTRGSTQFSVQGINPNMDYQKRLSGAGSSISYNIANFNVISASDSGTDIPIAIRNDLHVVNAGASIGVVILGASITRLEYRIHIWEIPEDPEDF
jgi:hypothetical protein